MCHDVCKCGTFSNTLSVWTGGWFCIKQRGCIASGGLCLRKLHGSVTTEVQILCKQVVRA